MFINVVIASLVASVVVAGVVTPLDMVFFKMMAKTTQLSSKASFAKIASDIYIKQRQTNGSMNALGLSAGATFIRYFFMLTSTNAWLNST